MRSENHGDQIYSAGFQEFMKTQCLKMFPLPFFFKVLAFVLWPAMESSWKPMEFVLKHQSTFITASIDYYEVGKQLDT